MTETRSRVGRESPEQRREMSGQREEIVLERGRGRVRDGRREEIPAQKADKTECLWVMWDVAVFWETWEP